MRRIALVLVAVAAIGLPAAHAQISVPAADGSDGPFVFVGDPNDANVMTIDRGWRALIRARRDVVRSAK